MRHHHPAAIVTSTLCLALASCERKPLADGGARIEAVRIAASSTKQLTDILPYDEALSWHEYEVKNVLEGILEAPRIRVAHWTVIRGKNVPLSTKPGETVRLRITPFDETESENLTDVVISDDLDPASEPPPSFMDMQSVLAENQTPEAIRYDYNSAYSEKMLLYWHIRHQLQLVVLGNSHAARAVNTGQLIGGDNLDTPLALNLGIGGAGVRFHCLLANDYLLSLPNLKTIIWMVSARTFNGSFHNPDKRMNAFKTSPGYDYDTEHRHELWPVPPNLPPVTLASLKNLDLNPSVLDAWGWTGRERTLKSEQIATLPKQFSRINYQFDADAWDTFVSTINKATQKGIRIYLVTSPIHPFSRNTPAADPDGSPHKAQKETVQRLMQLDAANPLVWFRDYNLNGAHDIPDDHFYDVDHLNTTGSALVTQRLAAWLTETASPAAAKQ